MNGWATFYKTCIVVATLVGAYLLYELSDIIIVLFLAIVFASAIRPLVVTLSRRGVPSPLAILLIYFVVFVFVSGAVILTIPPMVNLAVDLFSEDLLVTQINGALSRLTFLGERQFQIEIPRLVIPDYMMTMATRAAEDTARQQAWPVAQNTLVILGQVALAFVMGFYWLTSHNEIQTLLLRIGPYRRRADIELIWNDVEQTLGAYVRGQLIMMTLIGVISLIGLLLLGVPYAVALAAIAALTEAIPVIGPILGAIPAIIVGFTVSPVTALLIALFYLVVQQIEGNVLVPKIMEENVGLNPLLVLLALTAGAALNGVIGAILAIPVAGAVQVFVNRLLIQPAIEKSMDKAEAATTGNTEMDPAEAESPETNEPSQPASP